MTDRPHRRVSQLHPLSALSVKISTLQPRLQPLPQLWPFIIRQTKPGRVSTFAVDNHVFSMRIKYIASDDLRDCFSSSPIIAQPTSILRCSGENAWKLKIPAGSDDASFAGPESTA
ncbi:hypothetical protein PT974_09709 [Cladobotryum mycophilum]|uniref:Uncharacterized protein n=1 Tax=Cladobotryum mycophilum TaxID=491253 RepID=A0ABR0SHV6_9HYPO